MEISLHIPKSERVKLEKELQGLVRKFDDRTVQRIFTQASKPYLAAVQAAPPRADRVVKRYSTPKLFSRKRAPRGFGNVVAEYHPGNLGRSFKKLTFRGSSKMKAIFIGPKRAWRNPNGIFSTRSKVDGWYAHLVDGLDTIIKTTWSSTRSAVLENSIKAFRKLLEK